MRPSHTDGATSLTQSHYRTFCVLPMVDEADTFSRNMIDIHDTLAQRL
jgi:hypothetical protein